MAGYDGQPSKRQRTDEGRNRGQNYYNSYGPRGGRGSDEEKPNHILLMTVLNPAYPITVDVIHTICSPSGTINRIVIFKKNGVQAMVEFENLEMAKRAKQSLNGADIYSGCCTLKIEYAKPNKLNVHRNDSESWDYTNPNLGKVLTDRPALLQEPPQGFGPPPPSYRDQGHNPPGRQSYGPDGNNDYDYSPRGRSAGHYDGDYGSSDQYASPPAHERYGGPPSSERYGGGYNDGYNRRRGRSPTRGGGGGGGGYSMSGSNAPNSQYGSVLMVYGMNPEKMNADRLFNLFCLYGNVVRVKFLKSKEGCAMVQMGDAIAVERAIGNLNNSYFFDSKVTLGHSKQSFLTSVREPFDLADGTPSFADFMGNRNNRFTNPETAGKNRIQPPATTLHFFNTPFGITEEELQKIFEEPGVSIPNIVKIFPAKNEKSSSGIVEFESVSEAVEAVILCNHKTLPNPHGKFPFIFKLCFSSTNNRF